MPVSYGGNLTAEFKGILAGQASRSNPHYAATTLAVVQWFIHRPHPITKQSSDTGATWCTAVMEFLPTNQHAIPRQLEICVL
jgi:hypothetical protein